MYEQINQVKSYPEWRRIHQSYCIIFMWCSRFDRLFAVLSGGFVCSVGDGVLDGGVEWDVWKWVAGLPEDRSNHFLNMRRMGW